MGAWIRRLLLYPLLTLGGCHFLVTGSPIPLWHIEELQSPVAVRSVAERHLVLANGQTVMLPFIETLPADNPLFRAAIAEGVEVNSDGEVYGLIWLDRYCGNDPVVWKKMRVNLSDLAAALHPEVIDDSIVHPEVISSLAEHKRIDLAAPNHSHARGRLAGWDWMTLWSIRQQFEYSAEQAAKGADR